MTTEPAWLELNEQRKQEYNHPANSPCPVCNGSGHVMSTWSNSEYYHGLLTICPECGSIRTDRDAAHLAPHVLDLNIALRCVLGRGYERGCSHTRRGSHGSKRRDSLQKATP